MMQNKEVVILANGTFPESRHTKDILYNASFLVCCDGAANDLIDHNFIPNIIIGDGDSIRPELKTRYKDRILINTDQETNDLTKAVAYVISKGYQDVIILGGTGKREDHTIGNISLLMEYLSVCNVKMITETGVFIPCANQFQFTGKIRQQLSIFNFGCSTMTAVGLAYPIRAFGKWWEGTLNEVKEENVRIDGDSNFLIYITHDIK